MLNKRQAGVTLVELIVAMVIIAVGIGGMTQAFVSTSENSADPLVYKQMVVVAEGMMEEILLKPFDDPDPAVTETAREQFTHVSAFHNYGKDVEGIKDVNGAAIPGLEKYSVLVAISGVTLTGSVPALRITVTVTRAGYAYVLTGWRTDYS